MYMLCVRLWVIHIRTYVRRLLLARLTYVWWTIPTVSLSITLSVSFLTTSFAGQLLVLLPLNAPETQHSPGDDT